MRALVILCGRVIAILVIAEVTVLVAAWLAYRDPFAPYQPIMPGQTWEALRDYSCYQPVTEPLVSETAYCQFMPKEGTFSLVAVEYSQVIKRIGFNVRQRGMHLGDLLQCWGKPSRVVPDARPYATEFLNVHWGKRAFAAIDVAQPGPRLSHALPIPYLWIVDEPVSCGSR
jgi:hypothetical protein